MRRYPYPYTIPEFAVSLAVGDALSAPVGFIARQARRRDPVLGLRASGEPRRRPPPPAPWPTAGLAYGEAAIPAEWRAGLARHSALENLAERLAAAG